MIMLEKWQKDLDVYRKINSTFIIEGNVNDKQAQFIDEEYCQLVSLPRYLFSLFDEAGYQDIVSFDLAEGFYDFRTGRRKECRDCLNGRDGLSKVADEILQYVSNIERASVVIVKLANTLISGPEHLQGDEMMFYSKMFRVSQEWTTADSKDKSEKLPNLLILLMEKVNDTPAWFYMNNPMVRVLTVGYPDKAVRSHVVSSRLKEFGGGKCLDDEDDIRTELSNMTENMTLVDVEGVLTLFRETGFKKDRIKEVIKLFKFGETTSYWDKIGGERIRDDLPRIIDSRVKGQDEAKRTIYEIVGRACIGLSGMQGGASSRPKGVLFMAGPTGTGKTEMAKAISEFVFGDDGFITRFDMSEYQQPHSDQRLIGAPPGYVGYNAGGQLTNAIKKRPFCILLFDEIEKAHPAILDKFLQILEDGRLTDSSGKTVYFSETLIIFTSNLGISSEDERGVRHMLVTPEQDDYDSISTKVKEEIKSYFKFRINRPEILNRIGENFVVFDFIRPEIAGTILDNKIEQFVENIKREKSIMLTVKPEYREFLLREALSNLENGGRGIGNILESRLINKVSHIIIQENVIAGMSICLESWNDTKREAVYSVM